MDDTRIIVGKARPSRVYKDSDGFFFYKQVKKTSKTSGKSAIDKQKVRLKLPKTVKTKRDAQQYLNSKASKPSSVGNITQKVIIHQPKASTRAKPRYRPQPAMKFPLPVQPINISHQYPAQGPPAPTPVPAAPAPVFNINQLNRQDQPAQAPVIINPPAVPVAPLVPEAPEPPVILPVAEPPAPHVAPPVAIPPPMPEPVPIPAGGDLVQEELKKYFDRVAELKHNMERIADEDREAMRKYEIREIQKEMEERERNAKPRNDDGVSIIPYSEKKYEEEPLDRPPAAKPPAAKPYVVEVEEQMKRDLEAIATKNRELQKKRVQDDIDRSIAEQKRIFDNIYRPPPSKPQDRPNVLSPIDISGLVSPPSETESIVSPSPNDLRDEEIKVPDAPELLRKTREWLAATTEGKRNLEILIAKAHMKKGRYPTLHDATGQPISVKGIYPELVPPKKPVGRPKKGEGTKKEDKEDSDEDEELPVTPRASKPRPRGNHYLTALWSDQIDDYFKDEPLFTGTISSDMISTLPEQIPQGFVMNTASSDEEGEHWVAIYISPDSIEYYDPEAEPPTKKTMKDLHTLIESWRVPTMMKFKINRVRDQKYGTNLCGYFSLKFLDDRFNDVPYELTTRFKQPIKDESDEGDEEVRQEFKLI